MPDFLNVLGFFGYPVKEAKRALADVLTIQSLTEWQQQRKWEIFNFHYDNNPFYKNFIADKPTLWENIRVLKREHLINDFLSKIPPSIASEKLYISHSSGSSGQPIFFARDAFSHAYVWTILNECYTNVGISLNHKQARVFGVSGSRLNRFKVRLKDLISNRYRFNVFDLSDQALEKWLKVFSKENFEYIYGYSNSLIVFANFLKSKGVVLSTISTSLKACIVTSEVCTDKDTKLLEEAFGIPIYNEYGSSELGLMGFKKDGFWEVPDHILYIEVLDENGNVLPDGEVGYLVCTALFNKATPFIRYQNGDLGSIRRVNGRTRIEQIMGSLNDQAILPSGKKVPGISFYFVAQELLESSFKVKEFLFRQKDGVFIFEYVADEDLTDAEFLKLKKGLIGTLGQGLQLQTKRVSALQRGASGKFKHFISTKD